MKWNTLITPIQTHSDDDTLTETLVLLFFFSTSFAELYENYINFKPLAVTKKKKKGGKELIRV